VSILLAADLCKGTGQTLDTTYGPSEEKNVMLRWHLYVDAYLSHGKIVTLRFMKAYRGSGGLHALHISPLHRSDTSDDLPRGQSMCLRKEGCIGSQVI
jgi:hypothetical protein